MNACLYHQQNHVTNQIEDESIDQMDLDLIKIFIEKKKPILGICRGIQILNVYYGGTLIQDIPSFKQTTINHNPQSYDV